MKNRFRPSPQISRPPRRPTLRFSPTAWAKLLHLRDSGPTEVGGFGLSAADDLFYIEDVRLVRQTCTAVSVVFDDAAVADFFDQQVDQGVRPDRFARIWLHTHPGDCPEPSWTDESTFGRVFTATEWAVMFILARGGRSYARLRFGVGPRGEMRIPVAVDYSRPFPPPDFVAWNEEYLANVQEPVDVARFIPLDGQGSDTTALAPSGIRKELFDLWSEFQPYDHALTTPERCDDF